MVQKVNFELFPVNPYMTLGSTVVAPDLSWNAKNGIKSDFDCSGCGKGIGISWKQGVTNGLIVRCPTCGLHNEFVRVEI